MKDIKIMDLKYYGVIEIKNLPISRKIFYTRKRDIIEIFDFYAYDYHADPNGTVNNIKKTILKILDKDIRCEKLKKLNIL